MTDAISAVDEAAKSVGRNLDVINMLLPEISQGSRRRALKGDLKAYEKDTKWIENSDLSEKEKDLARARLKRELLHAENLNQIVKDAVPQFSKTENVNDMDLDWIDDFRGKAEKISNKDVQLLWSKLLAGEVNNHGTFSKKTMAALYELDSDTAINFSEYCTYAMQNSNRNSNFDSMYTPLSNWGASHNKDLILKVAQLKSLEDAGLITRQYNVTMTVPANSTINNGFLTNSSRIVFRNNEDQDREIYFTLYPFTRVGDQLCSLCNWGSAKNIEDIIKSLLPSPGVVASFIPKNLTGKIKIYPDGSFIQNTGQ